jgi:hypothetical protein
MSEACCAARRSRSPLVLALRRRPRRRGAPQGTALMIELPPRLAAAAQGANGFVVGGYFYGGGGLALDADLRRHGHRRHAGGRGQRDGKRIVGRALDPRGFEQAAIWTAARLAPARLGGRSTALRSARERLVRGERRRPRGRRPGLGRLHLRGRSAGRSPPGWWTSAASAGSPRGERRVRGRPRRRRLEEHVTGFRQAAKWVDGKEELIRVRPTCWERRSRPIATARSSRDGLRP